MSSKKWYYEAFGLKLVSEFPIPQVPEICECKEVDVTICAADLSDMEIREGYTKVVNGEVRISAKDTCRIRVRGDRVIEVDKYPEATDSHVAVFIMGSGMGAILHHRGYLPMHGSCVTNGKQAVLITGESGAGKSTTASEFLKHGWQLLTDDVAPVISIDPEVLIQSSYPSQKLWQDSLSQYRQETTKVHSLYTENNREKFGINVSDRFYQGSAPLSLIIRLLPYDLPTQIQPIEGMAKVDQLMRNTYRSFMIPDENRNQYFQKCVTMSAKVPMALVIRQKGESCAEKIYDMVTEYLEEKK